jgi:hypothetical protein
MTNLVGNRRHVCGPTVGNLHRMLQVRYCSAALIFDERMQIYGVAPFVRAHRELTPRDADHDEVEDSPRDGDSG